MKRMGLLENILFLLLLLPFIKGGGTEFIADGSPYFDSFHDLYQAPSLEATRSKRQAAAYSPSASSILANLNFLSASTGVMMNKAAQFSVLINMQGIASTNNDTILEIFTTNLTTNATDLTICDVSIESVGNDLMQIRAPVIQKNTNLLDSSAVDRVVIDLSGLYANNPSNNCSTCEVAIKFCVSAKNASATNFGANVNVGVAYINYTYIRTGLFGLTFVRAPTSTTNYTNTLNGTMQGPGTIPQGDIAIYEATMQVNVNVSSVTFSVITMNEIEDFFSIGNVQVKRTGYNYICLRVPINDVAVVTYSPSTTRNTIFNANFSVINLTNYGPTNILDADDEIVMRFGIFVPPNIPPNTELILASEMSIDSKIMWTGVIAANVTSFVQQPLSQVSSITAIPVSKVRRYLLPTSIPPLGSATFNVTLTLPPGSYINLVLTISSQASTIVRPCDVKLTRRGFNVHYLPPIVQNMTGNSTLTVDFGRVPVGNHSPLYNDSQVEFEISFAAIATGVTDVQFQATGQTTSASLTVTGPVQSGTVLPVVGNYTSIALSPGAAAAFNLNFMLQSGVPVTDFALQLYGDPAVPSAGVRICRAELSFSGNALPCIRKFVANSSSLTTYSTDNTYFEPWFSTKASLALGNVCAAQRTSQINATYDTLMSVNVALFLPVSSGLTSPYKFYAKVMQGGNQVANQMISLNIASSASSLGPFVALSEVQLSGIMTNFTNNNTTLPSGSIGLLTMLLKFPPNSRVSQIITVQLSAGLQICNVKFIHIGHNMPCIDPVPYGRWDYRASNYINFVNNSAILDFGFASTNLGNDPLVYNFQPDTNAVILGIFVKGTAAGIQSINAAGLSKNITVGPSITSQAAKLVLSPAVNILEPSFGLKIRRGPVQIYAYNVTVVEGDLLNNLTLNVEALDDALEISTVAITNVGDNFPCLNASSVLVSSNTSGTTFYTQYEISFDACRYAYSSSSQADTFTVEVALWATPKSSADGSYQITISGASLSASVTQTTTLLVDDSAPDQLPQDVSLYKVYQLAPVIPVGQRSWFGLGVRIPLTSYAFVLINVTAPLDANGRARVDFTGVRLNRTLSGRNVLFGSFSGDNVLYTSQMIGRLQEPSQVLVLISNVTNAGFTSRQLHYRSADDVLYVDFECMMTDVQLNTANATAPTTVSMINPSNNSIISSANINLTVGRDANRELERAIILLNLSLINPAPIYQQGDVIQLALTAQHDVKSRAEGLNTIIRIFKPDYVVHMEDSSNLSCNTSCSVDTTHNFYVDISVNETLFLSLISVNISFVVGPNRVRRSGGQSAAVVNFMSRAICNQEPFSSFPSSSSTYLYCGPLSQVSVYASNNDCWTSLGMNATSNNPLADCQITGSSALNDSTVPSEGRLGGSGAWIPAVRAGDEWSRPYLQVDFGTTVTVSGITVEVVPGYRSVSAFLVESSNDGVYFGIEEQGFLNSTERVFKLSNPFEARYARMVVVESQDFSGSDAAYLAVRMDWMGCTNPDSQAQTPTCLNSTSDQLLTNYQFKYMRHFVVDSDLAYAYVCDYRPDQRTNKCFLTPNGLLWKALPSYIGYLLGYDSRNKLILAMDNSDKVCLATSGGRAWTFIPPDDCYNITGQTTFSKSIALPGSSSTDFKAVTSNQWIADYWGLKQSSAGSYALRWG